MARNTSIPIEPYDGLAESAVTSNVIDLRDAFDFNISTWTSAGTASAITLQVSDWTGDGRLGAVPEASWSNYTSFTPSGATAHPHLLGPAYARVLRTPSLASHVFAARKLVR